jgi:hypothetical protein
MYLIVCSVGREVRRRPDPGPPLLTNSFRDPQLMAREARRLERWIDSFA